MSSGKIDRQTVRQSVLDGAAAGEGKKIFERYGQGKQNETTMSYEIGSRRLHDRDSPKKRTSSFWLETKPSCWNIECCTARL